MEKMLILSRSKGSLYPVSIPRPSRYVASSVQVFMSHWHQRLGHPTSTVVKSILKSNNLGHLFNNVLSIYDACQHAKSHRQPYNNFVHVTSSPLELIHMDVRAYSVG